MWGELGRRGQSAGAVGTAPVVPVPSSADFAGTLGVGAWEGALPGLGGIPSKPTTEGSYGHSDQHTPHHAYATSITPRATGHTRLILNRPGLCGQLVFSAFQTLFLPLTLGHLSCVSTYHGCRESRNLCQERGFPVTATRSMYYMPGAILSANKYLSNTHTAPEFALSPNDVAANKTKFTSQVMAKKSK